MAPVIGLFWAALKTLIRTCIAKIYTNTFLSRWLRNPRHRNQATLGADSAHIMLSQAVVGSSDRFSALPKDMIAEILCHLPIRDAINTSMLSKLWRTKWRSMGELVFDSRVVLQTVPATSTKLADFVYIVLLSHGGAIKKFRLERYIEGSCPSICIWLAGLATKGIQELTLIFTRTSPFKIPGSFYECETLTSVKLEHCVLQQLPPDKYFHFLVSLELCCVTLDDGTFEDLLTRVPALKILKVINCRPLTQFKINGSQLDLILVTGNCNRLIITAPVLRSLYIGFRSKHMLDETLQQVASVQCIRIWRPFMKMSPKFYAQRYSQIVEAHLLIDFEDYNQVAAVHSLCSRLPNLRKLRVQSAREIMRDVSNEAIWKAQSEILQNLQFVQMMDFRGLQDEVHLSKFILRQASKLENFEILWAKNVLREKRIEVMEMMKLTKKVSSRAELYFKG